MLPWHLPQIQMSESWGEKLKDLVKGDGTKLLDPHIPCFGFEFLANHQQIWKYEC